MSKWSTFKGVPSKPEPTRVKHLSFAPGLTHKHQAWLEKLAKDKCSSLSQKFVTYGSKKFYKIGTWGKCYKTIYSRNLQILGISWSVFPCELFQLSLVFAAKASAYQSEASFRFWTQGQALGLTHK